ncbi:MAG: hypothetical protein WC329_02910 [Candidatus Omnitrophota bacterium]|jgi:hypothetical protein
MDTKSILHGLIILSVSILIAACLISFAIGKKPSTYKWDVVAGEGLKILLNKETGESTVMVPDLRGAGRTGHLIPMIDYLKQCEAETSESGKTGKLVPVDYDPYAGIAVLEKPAVTPVKEK